MGRSIVSAIAGSGGVRPMVVSVASAGVSSPVGLGVECRTDEDCGYGKQESGVRFHNAKKIKVIFPYIVEKACNRLAFFKKYNSRATPTQAPGTGRP